MSTAPEVHQPPPCPPAEDGEAAPAGQARPVAERISAPLLAAIPVATAIAFAVHWVVSKNEMPPEAVLYSQFLGWVGGISILLAIARPFWPALQRWLREMCPILAAGMLFLTLWEGATAGLHLLPMPYFPGPAGVLLSMTGDRGIIFDSTWHSLLLLAQGYLLGVVSGVVTGISIGWFPKARYWGMPVLKVVGPIPATAWIPLAMVVSPSTTFSAVVLIALAVWFPVTMLTASGISNTRASYLDVARTLGANSRYLIFRVAIPAAMPNIFLGLFMGLGASFLTLVVAETVGVKSGLGWYVSWAQGWAEYGKVYGALIIMAVFFSTIMTALFKVRDRVLVWQKGTIKW